VAADRTTGTTGATTGSSRAPLRHAEREARRLADVVHGRLVEAGRTVAVAESLTGGLISAYLTAAPGTSTTFRGGLVVYSTDLKHVMAGVRADSLARYGAVHPLVATQMARGVRRRLHADCGLAVTGVAGPGEQDTRPVGEVYVAVATDRDAHARQFRFDGGRAQIRMSTVIAGLEQLIEAVQAILRRA